MATSKPTKMPDYIVEDDDFYGASLQKQIRKYRKKLKEIEELEQKPAEELDPLQQDKISKRDEHEAGIAHCEELLKAYVQAYADALLESPDKLPIVHLTPGKKELKKLEKKVGKPATAIAQQAPTAEKVAAPVQVAEPVQKATTLADLEARLAQVLNLVHFAQFFSDQNRCQEFQKMLASSSNPRDTVGVENVPDFGIIFEFYTKIFTYTEGSKLDKNKDKIEHAVNELQRYLLQNKEPALKNKSYGHLFDTVQNIVNSSYFREKNAEVHHHHVESRQQQQGAIGSEIRGQQHQSVSVVAPPQPAAHRVEHIPHQNAAVQPETKAVETVQVKEEHAPVTAPTQAAPQTRAVDWNQMIDDDEGYDEEENDDHYRPHEPRDDGKKEDDGFILVKNRRDERPPQGGPGGRGRGRGRGRGGRGTGRGGPRPPREGGDQRGDQRGNWRGPRRGGPRPNEGNVTYQPVAKESGVVQP